ncbi:ATP-binding protein, partial [Lysinibacillus fusiformis]|uniref:ATP-binding protein n=1 Tax=Lysinibacillus fusiformis TaxID=28031 RepID=UPI0020BF0F9A
HLNSFFINIEKKLSPAFQEKDIHFIVRYEKGLTVWADEARLEQILINLLNNALIYCASGDTTSVTAKKHNDVLSIIVQDTGKGIPK